MSKRVLPFPPARARLICTFFVSLSDWIVTAVSTEPGDALADLDHVRVGQPAEFQISGADTGFILSLAAAGYPQHVRYTTTRAASEGDVWAWFSNLGVTCSLSYLTWSVVEGVCYQREMRCARSGDAILVTHYELSARNG